MVGRAGLGRPAVGRRRTAALAAAVLAPLAGLVVIPALPAAAATVTLPDMRLLVPMRDISISINSSTGHRQLQFTHVTWDAGRGPFEIDPSYNSATGIASFRQAIYNSPRRGVWHFDHSVPLAVTGVFENSFDYRFPLTSFTLHRVRSNGTAGRVAAASLKTDYCITADTFVGRVPNSPSHSFIPQSNCTTPTDPLGWSVGWGDKYDQTDAGQPIDLTRVPNGTYILRGIVDPRHVLIESNRKNDVVDTRLRIRGRTVTVLGQARPVVAPPSVALTSPARGARVSGTVTLRARASAKAPASSLTSVQFLLDGQPLGSPDLSAPYTLSWPVGSTPPGRHLLSARAADSHGGVSTSPVRAVTVVSGGTRRVTAARPTADIVNPAPGQVVSGTIPVAVIARDNVSVSSVQFFLDGKPLSQPVTAPPYAVRWRTAAAAAGTHTLSARATGAGGLVTDARSVTVQVQNPAAYMACFIMQAVSAHGHGTVSTRPFHTAAGGETLLAFVSSGGPGGAARQTVTVSGAHLRWSLVARANSQAGDAEIWQAKAPRVMPAARVTSRPSRPGYGQELTVIAMQGSGGVGASALASAVSGPPSLRLTTTKDLSLVFAVGSDQGNGVARGLPFGWVMLRQWTGTGSSWSQYTNVPVRESGTVVRVGDTAPAGPHWNLAAVELTADSS